jgi:hypothetical protein
MKLSRRGSVSGTPCEMAAGNDVGGWWDGVVIVVVVVVVVVWPSSWKRKAQGGGLGQKPETSPIELSLGHAIGNSSGRRWEEVVVWGG